jgi:hypothetical protein
MLVVASLSMLVLVSFLACASCLVPMGVDVCERLGRMLCGAVSVFG